MTMFTFDKRGSAYLIEPKKVYWFIHPESPLVPLGFIRDGRGAFVIGGKTGSHFTGNAETLCDNLILIGSLGYIPMEIAITRFVFLVNRRPPRPSDKDGAMLVRIQRGE